MMDLTEEKAENAALEILYHFYPDDTLLRRKLLKHSFQVCRKALMILRSSRFPDDFLNTATLTAGALLHDVGIGQCCAPDILCCGTEPYITHGIIGASLLREYGRNTGMDLEKFARICERHTGAGLTAEEIVRQKLPLPEQDYLPETPEEKLVCLADKFFSKSGDMREKDLSCVSHSMEKFGPETLSRWQALCRMFGVE